MKLSPEVNKVLVPLECVETRRVRLIIIPWSIYTIYALPLSLLQAVILRPVLSACVDEPYAGCQKYLSSFPPAHHHPHPDSWRLRQTISCTNNVKIITVTMAMSIEQYHNQALPSRMEFQSRGAKVAEGRRTMSYFSQSAILHTWQLH